MQKYHSKTLSSFNNYLSSPQKPVGQSKSLPMPVSLHKSTVSPGVKFALGQGIINAWPEFSPRGHFKW